MISGLNHITLAVKDLDRSFAFYKNVLGFEPLMKHSRGAYFLAGDLWFCLDLDDATRPGPLPEYTHIAFTVVDSDFGRMAEKLNSHNVTIWKENKSEGASLYFLDPDGHKLEIHVGDWRSRLQSIREKPWNDTVELLKQIEKPPNEMASGSLKNDLQAKTTTNPFVKHLIFLNTLDGVRATETQIRAHIEFLRALDQSGKLHLAGPFADHKGGMLILNVSTYDEALAIAESDPFVINNVRTFSIREWSISCEANNHLGMG